MKQGSFVCMELNSFKHNKLHSNSICPINGTLTVTINPGQSGLGSNGNEVVLYIL